MANPLSVERQAYAFVKDEKAMRLYNSRGSKKNRLYLSDYEGVKGGAKIAVAAEIVTSPKLGLIDKQLYFLHEVQGSENKPIYYKINKSSFVKRMGIAANDIITDKDGKVDSSFVTDLIKAFKTKLDQLLDKVPLLTLLGWDIAVPVRQIETFERQFINCLASDSINRTYENICFYNTNSANKQNFNDYNCTGYNPKFHTKSKSRLIIQYNQESANASHTEKPSKPTPYNLQGEDISFRQEGIDQLINSATNPNGFVVLVKVTHKEYQDIMEGKPLSSKLRKALEAN